MRMTLTADAEEYGNTLLAATFTQNVAGIQHHWVNWKLSSGFGSDDDEPTLWTQARMRSLKVIKISLSRLFRIPKNFQRTLRAGESL
jgi:hypothetical protein